MNVLVLQGNGEMELMGTADKYCGSGLLTWVYVLIVCKGMRLMVIWPEKKVEWDSAILQWAAYGEWLDCAVLVVFFLNFISRLIRRR
ncbi:hypothetical protein MKX03_014786, partial [Papaver bracteatum]